MTQQEINEVKAIVARKLAAGEIRKTYSLPISLALNKNGDPSLSKRAIQLRSRDRDVLSGQPAVKVI